METRKCSQALCLLSLIKKSCLLVHFGPFFCCTVRGAVHRWTQVSALDFAHRPGSNLAGAGKTAASCTMKSEGKQLQRLPDRVGGVLELGLELRLACA